LRFFGFQKEQDAVASDKCPPGRAVKSGSESLIVATKWGVVRNALRTYQCCMAETPDKSMSLFTALASAAATAYALAYVAHAEWGVSRIVIREDAIGMAGLLAAAICVKVIFRRKNKGS
jgi:hypothetical protein